MESTLIWNQAHTASNSGTEPISEQKLDDLHQVADSVHAEAKQKKESD